MRFATFSPQDSVFEGGSNVRGTQGAFAGGRGTDAPGKTLAFAGDVNDVVGAGKTPPTGPSSCQQPDLCDRVTLLNI